MLIIFKSNRDDSIIFYYHEENLSCAHCPYNIPIYPNSPVVIENKLWLISQQIFIIVLRRLNY